MRVLLLLHVHLLRLLLLVHLDLELGLGATQLLAGVIDGGGELLRLVLLVRLFGGFRVLGLRLLLRSCALRAVRRRAHHFERGLARARSDGRVARRNGRGLPLSFAW